MATSQWAMVKEYEGLYDPIVGASEGHGRPSVTTPQLQLDRTFKLSGAYSDLKDELTEEVTAIDKQVIGPATEAHEYIQPLRKTIKQRENKRLDYEKAQEKVKKLQKKPGKTPKEDAALSKAEFEMTCASEVSNSSTKLGFLNLTNYGRRSSKLPTVTSEKLCLRSLRPSSH